MKLIYVITYNEPYHYIYEIVCHISHPVHKQDPSLHPPLPPSNWVSRVSASIGSSASYSCL